MSIAIQRSMTRGAAWMVVAKLLERSLGLASTLVLVRLLAPEDFGIVAMAMSFIAMAELLSAFGFDLALIQNQNASEDHYHAAWTCAVLLGLLITVLLLAAAEPIARFYGRPDVFWVVCALASGATIVALENIGVVAFRKELDFRKEFVFLISKKLIAVVVTIPLAFWLRSYWALVIGMLTSRVLGTLISYWMHPFRPRLSLARIGELMRFSKWVLVNSLIVFFKERTADFVIGNLHGARALGLFNVTNEFGNLPHTELAAPINRALLPGFAKVQQERDAMQATFIAAFGLLALIVLPLAALIHSLAGHLVPVVLGSKWLDGIPLMQVLPLAGALVALHSMMCAVLVAHGRPDSLAYCHCIYVLVLFAGLYLLVPRWAALGAAYAALSAAVLSTPAYLLHLQRHLGVPMSKVLAAAARPAAGAVAMVLVLALLPGAGASPSMLQHAGLLLSGCIAGPVAYALAIFLLWHLAGRPAGAEAVAARRLAQWLSSRRRTA